MPSNKARDEKNLKRAHMVTFYTENGPVDLLMKNLTGEYVENNNLTNVLWCTANNAGDILKWGSDFNELVDHMDVDGVAKMAKKRPDSRSLDELISWGCDIDQDGNVYKVNGDLV